jgi:hypothetical protein
MIPLNDKHLYDILKEWVATTIPEEGPQEEKKQSVAEATFGMMRSDPDLLRVVLEEDLYEA